MEWAYITVRIPRRLLEQVRGYAQGNGMRPRASLNATVAYLLDRGLAASGFRPADGGTSKDEEEEEEEEA